MDLTSSGIPEYGSLEPTNTVDESLQSHDGADTNLQSSNELSVSVEESVLSDDQLPGVAFSSDAVASSLSTNEMPLESTTEVAHSSKRADEQPSMTIFVQQKVSVVKGCTMLTRELF